MLNGDEHFNDDWSCPGFVDTYPVGRRRYPLSRAILRGTGRLPADGLLF